MLLSCCSLNWQVCARHGLKYRLEKISPQISKTGLISLMRKEGNVELPYKCWLGDSEYHRLRISIAIYVRTVHVVRAVYGDAWEGKNGAVPIRELVKIPESDVRAMQMEAQAIVTARKEEEKQDLWYGLL